MPKLARIALDELPKIGLPAVPLGLIVRVFARQEEEGHECKDMRRRGDRDVLADFRRLRQPEDVVEGSNRA
jgi:hypothetical protein